MRTQHTFWRENGLKFTLSTSEHKFSGDNGDSGGSGGSGGSVGVLTAAAVPASGLAFCARGDRRRRASTVVAESVIYKEPRRA